MAKDPFNHLPPLPDEEADTRTPDPRETLSASDANGFERDKAPRKILKNLSSLAVPVFALGIGAWLFFSDDNPGKSQPVAAKPTEVNEKLQANNTSALLNTLKADAETGTAPSANAVVPPTGQLRGGASPVPGVPELPAYDPMAAELAKKQADEQRRREEILASPLEAQGGTFKFADGAQVKGNVAATGRMAELQGELAEMNRRRQEALAANSPEKLMEMAGRFGGNSQEQAPRKATNEDFLNSHADTSGKNTVLRQQAPASSMVINQGTFVRAVLLSGVNSHLPGTVTAQVTSDVYDSINQRHVLIPKHSKLIGTVNSQIAIGQERILIAMTRLILPDGTWISLGGTSAADMIGQGGVGANVDNHFFKMFGSSLIVGAVSLLLPKEDRRISTSSTASGVETGGSIIGLALNDTVKTLMERNKYIAPTLTIPPGEEFLFMAAHDMAMVPYRPR